MQATVLITLLNDARVVGTIQSALDQGPNLSEVIVADGGSTPEHLARLAKDFGRNPRVRVLHLPGSVAATRNQALDHLRTPIVAFLDADQTAPPGWLDRLLGPLLAGRADFTGGPTRPAGAPRTAAERYVNREEERLYRAVATDLALLPMGNSAWRVELLRKIGGFDPRIAWGGEDYDVNLRALAAGGRGEFVPDAVVFHDQSHLDGFGRVLRRKYRYYFGAATAYLKNGSLAERGRASAGRFRPHHPIDLVDVVLKPLALVRARRYYRRTFDRTRPGTR